MTLATNLWDWMFSVGIPVVVITAFVVAVVFGALWALRNGYIGARDKTTVKGRKPCCPPGLGCNDPIGAATCRRLQAQNVASPDERRKLDAAWAEFHGASPASTTRKLRKYEAVRDQVWADAFARTVAAIGEPDNGRLLVESTVVPKGATNGQKS